MNLKFTRNNKKEQNVFAIFHIDCCVNKFDIACWTIRKLRAVVRNAYLDSAYFNFDFWDPCWPVATKKQIFNRAEPSSFSLRTNYLKKQLMQHKMNLKELKKGIGISVEADLDYYS